METVPPKPKRSRRAAYVVAAIAVLCIALSLTVWVRHSGLLSRWNGPEDWRGVPVSPTTLEQTGWRKYVEGGAWRNLSFDLSPNELRELGRCQRLALRQGVTINGVNQFSDDSIRDELESILKQHPKLFYGEYALSKWYESHGDQAKADALIRQAYADAPVILVQRYEYSDGTPAAGLHVQYFGIECNRVKKHSLDPSLKLTYWDLTTDPKGCIYLPAYSTVYRTDSMSFPDGLQTTYPRLGWFEVRGKVGVLPAAVVEKR
jgi:hypothetical protein